MKSGRGRPSKDMAGQIVEHFRSNGPGLFSAKHQSKNFDCSQSGLSLSLRKLVDNGVLVVTSGRLRSGCRKVVFKLADEYMVGDNWRSVLKSGKHVLTRTPKCELDPASVLALLDQQIDVEREKMRTLKVRRKSIADLLTYRQTLEDEIVELKRQIGLKLNQLRQVDKLIKEPISSTKLAKLSVRKNGESNQPDKEELDQDGPPGEVVSFEVELSHYDRISAQVARRVPVTREGFVGVPTDLSR